MFETISNYTVLLKNFLILIMYLIFISELLFLTFFTSIASKYIYNILKNYSRNILLHRFDTSSVILKDSIERAYRKIRIDDIKVYMESKQKLNDKEVKKFGLKFVELVKTYMGPNQVIDWIKFYGNEEAFYLFLYNIFLEKYLEDETIFISKKLNNNNI